MRAEQGPKPILTADGRRMLSRLESAELSKWLDNVQGDQNVECKDANEWLRTAQAKPLREHALRPAELPKAGPIPGVLWELWNGQFFWTSQSGDMWCPVPLGN